MKNFILILSLFTFSFTLHAQIPSGGKLTKNFVSKDINGNPVDIFADLAAGKTVFVDIFATTCAPCWFFHQNGAFKKIQAKYGPEGTDQIRVYAIEADERSTVEDLSTVSADSNPFGNWLEGINYPMINDHSVVEVFNVRSFPTIHVIRPNKTVGELSPYESYTDEYWHEMINGKENNGLMIGDVGDKSFCKETSITPSFNFTNLGSNDISKLKFELIFGEQTEEIVIEQSIKELQETRLNFSPINTDKDANVSLTLKEINDKPVNMESFSSKLIKPTLTTDTVVIKFTTDILPGETSWKLIDDLGKVYLTTTYQSGPSENGGAGGPDANKTFEYRVAIDRTKASCLEIEIEDGFGDGFGYYEEGNPVPGVSIELSTGEEIKPVFNSDSNFQRFNSISFGIENTSSVEDPTFTGEFQVNPNPVSGTATINIDIAKASQALLEVRDLTGKRVDMINLGNIQGSQRFTYDASKLSNGIYLFQLTANNQSTMSKVNVLK